MASHGSFQRYGARLTRTEAFPTRTAAVRLVRRLSPLVRSLSPPIRRPFELYGGFPHSYGGRSTRTEAFPTQTERFPLVWRLYEPYGALPRAPGAVVLGRGHLASRCGRNRSFPTPSGSPSWQRAGRTDPRG